MKVAVARVGMVGLLIVVLGLVAAAPAGAAYVFKGSFGEGKLALGEASGVAIHHGPGTEAVYVADTGNNRIVEYGVGGEGESNLASLTSPTFLAVDNSGEASNGDVYAVHGANETITKLTPAGVPVTGWGTAGSREGFGKIAGIAVDSSANLWVLGEAGELHELSAAGSESSHCTVFLTGTRKVAPKGIAVDGAGDLYFAWVQKIGPFFLRNVAKITSSCELMPPGDEVFPEGNAKGTGEWSSIGLDEADDSVFLGKNHVSAVNTGNEVRHFSSSGELIEVGIGSAEERLVDVAGLAVRRSNQALYATDYTKQYVAIFEPEAVEPPEVIFEEPGGVTAVTGTTAHFKAEINPDGHEVNPYEFHCTPSCNGGTGLRGSLPAGTALETVEATAEELRPGTEYKVWVTAKNAGGETRAPGLPSEGLPFTTLAIAPSIEEEAATEVSETTAALEARIDPGGAQTGYLVQYVTLAQFEASGFAGAAQTPEGSLAAGSGGIPVSAALANLAPSTAYVFRFVATNEVGPTEGEPILITTREGPFPPLSGGCPNEVFRTDPIAAALPDCRAYEQSTPVDKNGGGLGGVPGAVQATEEPDSITSFTQAGIPGGVGAQDYPTFISSRGEGSWSTQGLLPPQSLGTQALYLGLTPGGRYAVSEARGVGPGGESLGTALFRRDLRSGQMATIVPYDTECERGEKCYALAGASADGSRIVFETLLPLTGETPPGQPNVFEWEEATGQISLIDVNEAGEPLPEGGFAGPYDWADEEPLRGGSEDRMYVGAANAISPDGSQIVYTEAQEKEGEEEGHGQLYVRRGLGGPSPTTTKVSAYREGTSGPEEPAAFLDATPDGRYVFFKSRAALTGDSYAGEEEHESASLYRYDTSTGALLDLTPDPGEEHQDGPGVEGLLGASESGQVSYFVANAALTEEEGPSGETPVAGEPNLYRWQEGFPPIFVATLAGGTEFGDGDTRDWSPAAEDPALQADESIARTARVSIDGGAVVFSSRRALTGAPNRNADTCPGGGHECAELFRYAVAAHILDCLSCDPTGARPLGAATLGAGIVETGDIPKAFAAPVLPRNLSADGDRLFFQTPSPLLSGDENSPGCSVQDQEHATCMDVYEWEAPGAGSCTAVNANANGGCLSLISGGQGDRPSYFADADREGKNAYFFTTGQFVPADRDHLYDVYDAREYGGLASQHPPTAVPCESRQACQGPQAAPEASSTPGTSSLVSPGNPKANACRKGFVHRHGRCVKKPKHHKKRHHRKHKKHKKKHANARQRAGHGWGGRK